MSDGNGTQRDDCGRPFEEALLSGYIDGVLTQGDEQRVRVHLEDCAECGEKVSAIRALREATMTTQFDVPADDQWSEAPRTDGSVSALRVGWVLVVLWAVGSTGYGLYEFATAEGPIFWKLVAFAGIAGFALLLLSVLLDRVATWKDDPYRQVRK